MASWMGIDVSKLVLDICLLADTGEIKQLRVSNDALGFEKLLTLLEKDCHVVFEATGSYHLRLQQHLEGYDIKLSVINPRQVLSYAKSHNRRNKTDAVDALLLAQFARERSPEASMALSGMNAKSLLREIKALSADITRLKNRLDAAKRGLTHPKVMNSLKRRIELLEEEKAALEQQLEQIQHKERPKEFVLLQSIPGIGKRTANALLAEIGPIQRFTSASSLVAWAGLTPKRHESGKTRAYASISRMGSATLRYLLFMPSLAALRHNALIKSFYQRLTNKGKPKMVAIVACMAKLLRIVYGVLASGKPFNPSLTTPAT